ncbi:MAG: class I SAM-dependent methyltransferase [Ilumatobacteraceae bacterium]
MADQQKSDLVFAGSIPEIYERSFVPLIFQPYADDLARRLFDLQPSTVLEIAAGTGVVTRAMADLLPAATEITATDLNQPMLDFAASVGTSRPVTWRQADAMSLPFDDESFDAIACQFGAMFFPDRPTAYAEMRRVLRPGGVLLFNVWGAIEDNDFADVATNALAALFPDDPPRFMARTPHGYHDRDRIRADLAVAGFESASTIESVDARSRAATCMDAAIAYCQGTPLRNEIESRRPGALAEATDVVAAAIGDLFGRTDVDGAIRALVVTALKN